MANDTQLDINKLEHLVRVFIRDYPVLNRLLNDIETSPQTIKLCILMAVDDFNVTPPPLSIYSVDNFPSLSILMYGTIANILDSVAIVDNRNMLSYSDGSVSQSPADKGRLVASQSKYWRQLYEQQKLKFKHAANLNSIWGSGVETPLTDTYLYNLYEEVQPTR